MAVRTEMLFTVAPAADGQGTDALSAKDKAQIRRAQVRKAQIQHRQRKANYTKELELDVVRIRELISQAEADTAFLRKENAAIRRRLKLLASGPPTTRPQQEQLPLSLLPLTPHQQQLLPVQMDTEAPLLLPLALEPQQQQIYDHVNLAPPSATAELFGAIDVAEMTVTLAMDETLGTPRYQISSSSSGPSERSVSSPATTDGVHILTPEQEALAINFILSLEHICWDHFSTHDFPKHGDESEHESCHTLMASTFCMSSAPDSVYEAKKAFKKVSSKSASPVITWQSTGLSLQALYDLASSLNLGDQELTPVQAWFELAAQYDVNFLLNPDILHKLKTEFKGVVKCVQFGAAIERQAFESIVARVLGPELGAPGLAL